MAQTKTAKSRSSSTSGRSKNGTTSRRTNSKAKSGSAKSQSRSRASATSRKSTQSSRSTATRRGAQNGKPDSRIGAIAQKAKGPALAGGAALVGLAGGLAMTRDRRRNGLRGKLSMPKVKAPKNLHLPKPSMPDMKQLKPDSALKAIGNAAGQVAERSRKVNEVASQVQQASDAISNSKR